ncbi:MAG: TM1812 family CRISPR-associated protein [Clostridia bacterium]|nr:TM1812 family CRISPR-associated protein [Clostridia bacterium]
MKKIVFSNLPMKKELNGFRYKVDGNDTIEYDGEVIFPVNSVLARTMKKGDKIKVVLLSKDDIEGNSAINAGIFQKELNNINRGIGADIEYITIATPFEETRGVHETLLRDMIDKLENGAEIIGDVTYGPKPLPIIMFAVMNFAEKFFSAKIKNIVYGKVDFVDDGSGMGKTKPVNPVLYDLTPLYYLNSVTNAMEYKSSDEAVKALDVLLDL